MKNRNIFAPVNYNNYKETPTLRKKAAVASFIVITAFCFFDQIRSIGQNTEADSLSNHARITVVKDFNTWEQFKDYLAAQDEISLDLTDAVNHDEQPELALPPTTYNEDKAPLFDLSQSIDLSHLVITNELFGAAVALKMRRRD